VTARRLRIVRRPSPRITLAPVPLPRLAAPLWTLAALAAACHRGPTSPAARPDAWQRLTVPGAPVPLYAYPETIERYAPDDRGAYVVRIAPGEDAAALARSLGATDDILGEDGYVVRLDDGQRTTLAARPGVTAVAILQPAERRSLLLDRAPAADPATLPEARIDLFADASPDEVAAVAAWVTWRGGEVTWQGRLAVQARLPREVFHEASRLSPVRWIE